MKMGPVSGGDSGVQSHSRWMGHHTPAACTGRCALVRSKGQALSMGFDALVR